MRNDEPSSFVPLDVRFERVVERLLARETLDLYEEGVSRMFELIATNLLADVPSREYQYFDGVVPLESVMKTSRQVEFIGEMIVGKDKRQWAEDFRATVTDKRITKQGLWIIIWIGSDRAEGELSTAFGYTK